MRILSVVRSKMIKAILPLLAVLFFLSCQKEVSSDLGGSNNVAPDLSTKVTSSVSGFVIDENNAPVENAVVSAGGSTASTDKYGYFSIKNVQVVKTAATVTVSKAGYFKGIKTYIADNNKSAFFRIKLLPKTVGGNIDAAAGGNVTLSSGMIIALPANGVVVAASNASYTGPVTVSASWIDPVALDLNQVMPGDLRGINTEGAIKRLTTFGMVAVELTGSGGQLLQIAPGKSAILTFPIPSSIAGTAPSSIPLWSFDESNGLWKEESSAVKTGNTYVGSVSHFSFWNCDVPNDYVQLDLTLHNADGSPIPFALVRVTDLGSTGYNSMAYGYTDSSGFVRGAVPSNAQLKVEVFSNYWCTSSNYSQTVTTTNTNLSLGTIIINTSTSSATVTGTVVDCSNNPVSNGNIIVHEGWQYTRYPLNADGTFSFSRMLCSGTGTVMLIPEDIANAVQGDPVSQTLTTGANAVGTLQACGVSITEFLTWAVDGGATTTLAPPADSLGQYGSGSTNSFFISGSANIGGPSTTSLSFGVDATGIAVGTTQVLQNIYASQILSQNISITTNPVVNITEYGPVGGFIAGNFNATVIDNTTSTTHTIVCSFRVRRSF